MGYQKALAKLESLPIKELIAFVYKDETLDRSCALGALLPSTHPYRDKCFDVIDIDPKIKEELAALDLTPYEAACIQAKNDLHSLASPTDLYACVIDWLKHEIANPPPAEENSEIPQ